MGGDSPHITYWLGQKESRALGSVPSLVPLCNRSLPDKWGDKGPSGNTLSTPGQNSSAVHRGTCRDLHASQASLECFEYLQQRANTGVHPIPKTAGLEVHPGAAPFPYFHTEQPNTPTLAGQDVVVGKNYMEERLFAK